MKTLPTFRTAEMHPLKQEVISRKEFNKWYAENFENSPQLEMPVDETPGEVAQLQAQIRKLQDELATLKLQTTVLASSRVGYTLGAK